MLKVKFLNFGKRPDEDGYCFKYGLEDVYNKSWVEVIHMKFRDFITMLIYDYNCNWVEWLISTLSQLEMEIKLLFDKELRNDLYCCNVGQGYDENGKITTKAVQNIPKHTLYCQGCAYGVYSSSIARFFYGEQSDGWCYYLGKGDFSFTNPTDLLWDGCKCCGINEDIEIDEDEYYAIGEEQLKKIRESNELKK